MCRYAFSGPYKEKFACFECRKVFRQLPLSDVAQKVRLDSAGKRLAKCPECSTPMHNMGKDFHAPCRSDLRQWRKVKILHGHGIGFHSCGCGPGERPARLSDVPAFLQRIELAQQQSECQRIREMRRAKKDG